MEVIVRLRREFAYNAWANRQTLESLRAAREVPARAAEVMAHIIAAEWLWLRRLGRPGPELPVWPALSVQACDAQLQAVSAACEAFLAGLSPEQLEQAVAYTNSKGERWSNAIVDILTHVLLHSSYHRGQIATLLGRAGEKAAYSDYIECVRRGHLEGRDA